MSNESPSKLRNGNKTISRIPRLTSNVTNTPIKPTTVDNSENTQSTSQDSIVESQRELQNKVDSLKGQVDGLKSLLEKLVHQGEQRSAPS